MEFGLDFICESLNMDFHNYILILYSKVMHHSHVRSSQRPRWSWIQLRRPSYSTTKHSTHLCVVKEKIKDKLFILSFILLESVSHNKFWFLNLPRTHGRTFSRVQLNLCKTATIKKTDNWFWIPITS